MAPADGRWHVHPPALRRRHARARDRLGDAARGPYESSTSCPRAAQAPDVVRIVAGRQRRGGDALRRCVCASTTATSCRGCVGTMTRSTAVAGPDSVRLRTPGPRRRAARLEYARRSSRSGAGDRVPFVLTWHPSHEPPPTAVRPGAGAAPTPLDFWRSGPRAAAPSRARTATPSVARCSRSRPSPTRPPAASSRRPPPRCPSRSADSRNWDYRYCWLRDATLHAPSADRRRLPRRGQQRGASGCCGPSPATRRELQIMYGVDGTRRLPEAELPWLAGYEGSKPVRTGNAASDQLQLDVWGETLDGLALARDAGLGVARRRVGPAGRADGAPRGRLGSTRQRPVGDAGRTPPLHPLQGHGLGRRRPHGRRRAVLPARRPGRPLGRPCARRSTPTSCRQASTQTGSTFTQSYGAPGLDASLLLIPRVGFLPPTDPRVLGTIAAVQNELTEDGFVQRYHTDERRRRPRRRRRSVPRLLVLARRRPQPRRKDGRGPIALFERLLTLRNDVGLLSEEWDPNSGSPTGQHPAGVQPLSAGHQCTTTPCRKGAPQQPADPSLTAAATSCSLSTTLDLRSQGGVGGADLLPRQHRGEVSEGRLPRRPELRVVLNTATGHVDLATVGLQANGIAATRRLR